MPLWIKKMLYGNSATYNMAMQEIAMACQDWGLKADIQWYHKQDICMHELHEQIEGGLYMQFASLKKKERFCANLQRIFSVRGRSIVADERTRQKKTIQGPFDSW